MSASRTGTVPMPSVQSIAAGLHEDGETVTVTGVLNNLSLKRTKQGNDWAGFHLIGERTSIDITVFPLPYQEFGDLLGPICGPDRSLVPPTVTVTGRLDARGTASSLIATAFACHGHENHGPHPNRRLPAAVRADMDLAVLTGSVRRIVQELRRSGEQIPEGAAAALAEIGQVLHRHGYCADPTFPELAADDIVSATEVIATLREGGDAR